MSKMSKSLGDKAFKNRGSKSSEPTAFNFSEYKYFKTSSWLTQRKLKGFSSRTKQRSLYRVRHLTFFFSTSAYFEMVTLSSRLIWHINSFILPPNEYGCVYAWTTLGSGPAIDLQKMPILAKKIVFSDENPTLPKRITVWCGFWSRGIIGKFFFENEQWEAVTVNGDRFRNMLNDYLYTKIEEEDIGNIWFQQDGATCHTAEATLDVLRFVFEDRIISRRAAVVRPPRSCDLKLLDYYLWGAASKISVTPTSQRQLTL